MLLKDTFRYSLGALTRHGIRTVLILLAVSIGVAAIIILTSLGESARKFVTGEFSSLGTNLLIVLPGRSETTGAGLGLFTGETTRDLTLDDANALKNSRLVKQVAPIVVGSAEVSWQQRKRETPILGSTSELLQVRQWNMHQGKFLPPLPIDQASPVCVLGIELKRELFGSKNALGNSISIGDRRFRVIGVLASEGRSIGVDVEKIAIIPAASAQSLFNTPSVFRILVEARSREDIAATGRFITRTIKARHQNEEDITVVTQDAVLATFDRILNALTLTLGGIAAISLAVAGILIMNIMLVSVSQRTSEIGLLKALGATPRQILTVFLMEAFLLTASGAIVGLILGNTGTFFMSHVYSALQATAPWWAEVAAVATALIFGLVFGSMPARRASRLDPVQALARK